MAAGIYDRLAEPESSGSLTSGMCLFDRDAG
jgi:hypothetical protein